MTGGKTVTELEREGAARDEIESELRESKALLSAVFGASPNQIMLLDEGYRVRYVNHYIRRKPEEVLGINLLDFLSDADRDRVKAVFEQVWQTGEPAAAEVGPNPPYYHDWVASKIGPVMVDGKVIGLVVNNSLITDMVELQSRLLVADRLASQGTLAASVAHEINNPLTYVLANLQRLELRLGRGDVDIDKALQWIEAAAEGAERIRNVVRDLSSLSRAPDAKPTETRIEPILESSIRMAQVELQHRARLVKNLAEDVPAVLGDESRLGQVFLNLIINAAQAIPVGDVLGNQVAVTTSVSSEGWAVIEVRDTGEGIAEDVAAQIFEPFITTKDIGGTGLGLYVCASIVRSLGGRLSAEANADRGSCFRVELPPARRAGSPKRRTRAPSASGRAEILVVDDEPGVLEFMVDALEGHEVTTVGSGREALAKLADKRFDLVLCDLIMPEVSGMDVFERITAEQPELASTFVFMTGGAFTHKSREFVEQKARPLLEKPFAIADLIDEVERVLALRAQAT